MFPIEEELLVRVLEVTKKHPCDITVFTVTGADEFVIQPYRLNKGVLSAHSRFFKKFISKKEVDTSSVELPFVDAEGVFPYIILSMYEGSNAIKCRAQLKVPLALMALKLDIPDVRNNAE
jgi:BTB/POZ domain